MKEKLIELLRMQAQATRENLGLLVNLVDQASRGLEDTLILEAELGVSSGKSGQLFTELCRLEDGRREQELALHNLLQQCRSLAVHRAVTDSY